MASFNKIRMAGASLATGAVVLFATLAPAAAMAAQDCDANAMMWCGATTKAQFETKLHNGDGHNSAANLQKIYLHEGHAFNESEFNSASTVNGTVYKDGRVVVTQNVGSFKAGEVVATGAQSFGRQFMAGSTKSGSLWVRSTSVSFASGSIPAFIDMQGGTFHWFVIKSCGNLGTAHAVVVKKPVPTKTVEVQQKQVTVVVKQEQKQEVQPQPVETVVEDQPTPIETVVPQTTQAPQVLSTTTTSLPDTGPEMALGGVAGLTAIGYSARAYLRSKKSLLGALRKPGSDR